MYVEEQRSRGRKINYQGEKKGTFYILHIHVCIIQAYQIGYLYEVGETEMKKAANHK